MLADFGQFALIFEHKIWSSLSSCQLKKYRKFAESNQKWTQYKLILITGSTQQHEQNPDLALTWSDIYQFLINWLETKSNDTLVRDFSDMLVEENLGPAAPVSYESIVSYWTAALLEPNLQKITKQAAKEDWNGVLEKIGFNRDVSTLPNQVTYQGTYQNDNGGLGVFIENGYFPSFFICTLLNVSAYKVQPSNLHLGPDFCLILNFNIDKWSLFEGKFFDSEEYTKLRSRLKNDASSWDFHDHRFEVARPNRWYHLHLRKPLAEVLRDTITFNQQVEKFVSHGRESIEILLAGGEIEALTKRLHSEIPIDS